MWDTLAKRDDAAVQFPYTIGKGDISLVEATMGAEWIPHRDGSGGTTVAVVLTAPHVERKKREAEGKRSAADLNPAIHHLEGCCVAADYVAVDANMDGAKEEYSEIVRAIGREMDATPGMVAPVVELVGDWGEYVRKLKGEEAGRR